MSEQMQLNPCLRCGSQPTRTEAIHKYDEGRYTCACGEYVVCDDEDDWPKESEWNLMNPIPEQAP